MSVSVSATVSVSVSVSESATVSGNASAGVSVSVSVHAYECECECECDRDCDCESKCMAGMEVTDCMCSAGATSACKAVWAQFKVTAQLYAQVMPAMCSRVAMRTHNSTRHACACRN